MSRKIKNLEKFWLDEGYIILRNFVTENRGDIFEIELHFKRQDSEPIDLLKEWDSMKHAASRQSFYVMPNVQLLDYGVPSARVHLIPKSAVNKALPLWKDIASDLSESYWSIQQDPEMMELNKRRDRLYTLLRGIQAEVSAMYTNTPSKNLMEGKITYLKWETYKSELNDFVEAVQSSEKVSEELRNKLEELTTFYDLSML